MKFILLAMLLATPAFANESILPVDDSRKVNIRGTIEPEMAERVVTNLRSLRDKRDTPIYVYISSHGGSIPAGELIKRELYIHQAIGNTVNCVAIGPVMSMALFIYDICDVRFATRNSTFLWHHILGMFPYPTPLPVLQSEVEEMGVYETVMFDSLRRNLGLKEDFFMRHARNNTAWPAESLKKLSPDYFTIIRTTRPK